ncbi:MAG: hypothetical protein EXS05_13915 [Planctomycetaceae bacterium]|nr:hypothetical protein [Planctomycetaceae bacterium]
MFLSRLGLMSLVCGLGYAAVALQPTVAVPGRTFVLADTSDSSPGELVALEATFDVLPVTAPGQLIAAPELLRWLPGKQFAGNGNLSREWQLKLDLMIDQEMAGYPTPQLLPTDWSVEPELIPGRWRARIVRVAGLADGGLPPPTSESDAPGDAVPERRWSRTNNRTQTRSAAIAPALPRRD